MALVLDATLEAAQEEQVRRPIAEVLSGSFLPDVPFDGQLLTGGVVNEAAPNMIGLSSGRMVLVMKSSVGGNFVYTDPDRQEFFTTQVPNSVSFDVVEMSPVELPSGDVGVIILEENVSTWRISRVVLSETGETVSSLAVIESWAKSSYAIGRPAAVLMPSGNYLLAYGMGTGGTFTIQGRTSSDFLSWGSASALSIGGLDSAKRRDNVSLLVDSHDDVLLFFDYLDEVSGEMERTNIYYSVSSDNGSSWSSAVAITNYTDFTAVGLHPDAIQLVGDQIKVAYYEQLGALHMDHNTEGWSDTAGDQVRFVSFDPVLRKVYSVAGTAVVETDMDSWTVTNLWDHGSVPAIPSWFGGAGDKMWNERHLVAMTDIDRRRVILVNALTNTVTIYAFTDLPAYGIYTNVEGLTPGAHAGTPVIRKTWIDFTSQRLYLYFQQGYLGVATDIIGYIDLSQTAAPYTFNQIVTNTFVPEPGGGEDMWIDYSENIAITGTVGWVYVYSLETGTVLYSFNRSLDAAFPYNGSIRITYQNRNIYFTFTYTALYGQEDQRGLCRINLDDSSISFIRPTWATLDSYGLYNGMPIDTGEILIAGYYGVSKYNPLDGSWVIYNNTTLPGMTPDGASDGFYDVAYDSLTGTVFTGSGGFFVWTGLIAFSIYGFIRQSHYIDGQKNGSWAFGADASLVQGLYDYEATIAKEPGTTSFYAFWTRQSVLDTRIAWDKNQPAYDLSDFLLAGSPVTIKRSIDGSASRLDFSVSHGHLFDPHNTASLLSPVLKKFRKISVRFGELVSGVEHWAEQGTFGITEGKMSYERGQYPVMKVTAEDKRSIWGDIEVLATEHFEAFPEAIITDVLETFAAEASGDITLPTFDGRYSIWYQWLDADVKRIVEEIANRFGYFIRVTVDDKISAGKISNVNPVDHAYSDTTKIRGFTPDDSFSDWTNQVTVVGESRDFIDVLMDEEAIMPLSGTVGWFGHKKTIRVYYSEDREKRCRNPRLDVIESVKNFNFRLGGGGESITATDAVDYLWCEVTIEMPNLVPEAIGLVAAITALGASCGSALFVPGYCFLALCILLAGLFYIVSSFALYQYQLYARPMGKERQSIQAVVNDTELQSMIGRVVSKKIDEPLAITVAQCFEVANQELLVAQLQRNRVSLSKIAHLQDEEGDTITFPHPYTGLTLKVFITDITRSYTKPKPGEGTGGIFDSIDGWVL